MDCSVRDVTMSDAMEIARQLVFALRRIEADAQGAVAGAKAKQGAALEAIRDAAGKTADDAAKALKMPPYGQ